MLPRKRQKKTGPDANKQIKRRTFTGCDTCRKRKVKCDGRRPICLRCEKSKVECLGYWIKLKFTEPLIKLLDGSLGSTPDNNNSNNNKNLRTFQRRQIPFMNFLPGMRYPFFEDMDPDLDYLCDENYHGEIELHRGPFRMFPKSESIRKSFINANNSNNKADLPKIPKNELPSISPIISSSSINQPPKLPSFSQSRIFPFISNAIAQSRPQNESHDRQQKSPSSSSAKSYSSLALLKLPPKKHTDLLDTSKNDIKNSVRKSDNIIPRTIWIHPRLRIDAMLTYQGLIGSVETVTDDWKRIEKTIFAERYGFFDELPKRIVDKFNIPPIESEAMIKTRINEVIRALGDNAGSISPTNTFVGLLKSHRVQELVRLFVKSQPNVMFLSYNGCLFDSIVIPLLYRIVGELMVFETSVGLPGSWKDAVDNSGMEFRSYCDVLKRTYCMVALSIAAFSEYKALYNENGLYDGSLNYLKCYIALREMSLINLSKLIKPIIGNYVEGKKIKIANFQLLNRLLNIGLFKEFVLTLMLAIYQDSNLDILHNYKLLYGVLESISDYFKSLNSQDEQLDQIWEWFRYLNFFFRSTSTIDVENYEISDDGFEDLNSDYNLIQNFEFNDSFKPNEYNKIEIKPGVIDDYDDEEDDEEEGIKVELPKRLANRPQLEDKPPRSFTVSFHFNDMEDDNDDDDEDDDDDDLDDDGIDEGEKNNNIKYNDDHYEHNVPIDRDNHKNDKKGKNDKNDKNDKNENEETKGQILVGMDIDRIKVKKEDEEIFPETKDKILTQKSMDKKTVVNNKGVEVDALTGLTIGQSSIMSLKRREQLISNKKQLLKIPQPLELSRGSISHSVPSASELSFGIPISLLEIMERTVRLADHRNWFLRKKMFPRNFPKFCCDLEEDLMNWCLPWDLYEENRERNNDLKFHSLFHEALYHFIISFYNTILLFFFRIIKDIHPSLLQNHVISTLTHLEQLKKLSIRSHFLKDMKILPPFWCFFLAGSDAIGVELQNRFDELGRTWFVPGNKWIGKQIMMEIWRSRNFDVDSESDDDKETSWLDMVKGWEVSGFH